MKKPSIYFDYNSTTPLDSQVREVMLPFLGEVFGNPSSVHHIGRRARFFLDDARERIASVFSCKPSEITFTSGGTESNNLAILGFARRLRDQGRHLITSQIEHHAVLECFRYLESEEGFRVTYVAPDSDGRVSPAFIGDAMRPDTTLVSLMAANNEVGSIQPVAEVGALCRQRGVIFHTDAVQWLGKEPFINISQFNADLVSVCSHKFHGPKGAGVLYVRSPLNPTSILYGGKQENERRPGTENIANIAGLARALELFVRTPVFVRDRLAALTTELRVRLAGLDGVNVIDCVPRLANTLSFTMAGTDSMTLLAALDIEGICASSGSACTSGALEPSHVLRAMGCPAELARSLVRFSIGRETTRDEIKYACALLPEVICRVRNGADCLGQPLN